MRQARTAAWWPDSSRSSWRSWLLRDTSSASSDCSLSSWGARGRENGIDLAGEQGEAG